MRRADGGINRDAAFADAAREAADAVEAARPGEPAEILRGDFIEVAHLISTTLHSENMRVNKNLQFNFSGHGFGFLQVGCSPDGVARNNFSLLARDFVVELAHAEGRPPE